MPPVPVVKPDGVAIRNRRLDLGLTPEQVAKKIGRHHQTIRRIENGNQVQVSETLLAQIAHVLGCHRSELTRAGEAAA
jgi:transcriptional regulator with XRE-family HTH domain